MPDVAKQPAKPVDRRDLSAEAGSAKPDRRVYVWWSIGLGLLLGLGLFCWLVLEPFLQARAAVERVHVNIEAVPAEIARLGGPDAAIPKLILYVRLPDQVARFPTHAVHMLAKCGPGAVPPLIALLRDKSPTIRLEAARCLGRMGDLRAVDPLIRVLADEDEGVVMTAASSLGELGDPRATKALIAALEHGYCSVRRNAAFALSKIATPEVVAPLITAFRNEKDASTRQGIARSLWNTGSKQAIAPLIDALGDTDTFVRAEAAAGLGRFGDSRAVPPLISILGDTKEYFTTRIAAAEALAEIGDPRAIGPLESVARDFSGDSNERNAAVEALKKMKGREARK